eukprot:scaffold474_cov169-Ochromonas_danica.AAC.9
MENNSENSSKKLEEPSLDVFKSLEDVAKESAIGFAAGSAFGLWSHVQASVPKINPEQTLSEIEKVPFKGAAAVFSGTLEAAKYLPEPLPSEVVYGVAGASTGALISLSLRPISPVNAMKKSLVLGLICAGYSLVLQMQAKSKGT